MGIDMILFFAIVNMDRQSVSTRWNASCVQGNSHCGTGCEEEDKGADLLL